MMRREQREYTLSSPIYHNLDTIFSISGIIGVLYLGLADHFCYDDVFFDFLSKRFYCLPHHFDLMYGVAAFSSSLNFSFVC